MKIFVYPMIFVMLISALSCSSKKNNAVANHPYTNHLINESSPYLLQHAHNPVDWYPWGEAALQKAKTEDKMLIISVGYAACHWCHVMEHESFEDTTIAKIMNEHFVCIKVDREERPDIDDVYMTACHLAGQGSCGWPLNAFALPDGRPFWAGTYFPKDKWKEVMQFFIDTRKNNTTQVEEWAGSIAAGMKQANHVPTLKGDFVLSADALTAVNRSFLGAIDYKNGGRNGQIKFPMPANYEYLLRQYHLTDNQKSLDAVTVTLDKMANGGIYDQLGGGFARYSTDPEWKVPHFEKMLYDNGQLVSLYARAYQATKNPLYQKVVEETIGFVERELMDEAGAFYSSLDADSEGVEGKFYVWSLAEVQSILSPEEFSLAEAYYQLSEKGNWEDGHNILLIRQSMAETATKIGLSEAEGKALLASAHHKLWKARSTRIRPGLDDKCLTSWNSLMLTGYIDAYFALGNRSYRETALKNATFLANTMMSKDGQLNRNYKNGQVSINGFLDEYAVTAWAFMRVYEATFDEQWMHKAQRIVDYAIAHFYDDDTQLFYYTSDLDPPLVTRKKELSDNVIPSSNSMMGRVLLKLGHYQGNDYDKLANKMAKNMSSQYLSSDQPFFYANWLSLYSELANPTYEVAIIGPEAATMRDALAKNFHPNILYVGGDEEGSMPLLEDRLVEGSTMIYVCQNKVCKFPVETVEEAWTLLNE